MAAEPNDDDRLIDESKLTTENGDIYLFTWLSDLDKSLKSMPADDLKSHQSDFESILTNIIKGTAPYPPPGRPLRNLVARCLISLYSLTEARTLFDTLQKFMAIVGDLKAADRDSSKIAALYCIGEVMLKFGSQVMSFMAEIGTVTIKIYRSSSSISLRTHALMTLHKALLSARRAVPDPLARDILKQMRNGLSDKALPVQRAAAEVLMTMYSTGSDLRTQSDIESILLACTKSLESADQLTRHSLSRLVGQILTAPKPLLPPPTAPTKSPQPGSVDDDDTIGTSPAVGNLEADTVRTILKPEDMFGLLAAQFNKPNTSRKTKIGLFDFYCALITSLGTSFIDTNYFLVVSHFMTDIIAQHQQKPSTTTSPSAKYEELLLRKLVGTVLHDLVGVRMLSEQGQITAIQELANKYLKRWPAMMPGQTEPTSQVLVCVLREVCALLGVLGNAPAPVQDVLAEPLVTLLSHPTHAVRINAAWALRCFCESTPTQLAKTLLTLIDILTRDLAALPVPSAPSASPSMPDRGARASGHAAALSALVSLIPTHPLYLSYDLAAKVLDTAISLLKRSGEHELSIAETEVEIAWTCIASLMALGPNFVRGHLPQLLVLWRNALPKPTSKDTATAMGRSAAEWAFLVHVRESALGAIYCFLKSNSPSLVTLDVTRRISSLLTNALLFMNAFASQNVGELSEQHRQLGRRGLGLQSREALLRRRVFQCFGTLGLNAVAESTQSALLQSTVGTFSGPEYGGSGVQAAIAASASGFTSVWQSADGYAWGVTGIDIGRDEEVEGGKGTDRLNRDMVEVAIDDLHRKPVIGCCEYDPLLLCQTSSDIANVEPYGAATAVVDSAIELFAQLLPLQDLSSSVKVLNQCIEGVRSNKLERNAGRKAAVLINTVIAVTLTLRKVTGQSGQRQAREVWASAPVTGLLAPFLKSAVVESDPVLREATSEAIGRLASLAGTTFLAQQIKQLVDQVVSNRDPYGRAGCASAFGTIHSHVGGLAAGPLLKTTVNILMSLSNDPHPVVHFYALDALGSVISAASLAYGPFVSSTIGMLFKLYLLDSHEQEGGSLAMANMKGDLPAYQAVCHVIDASITVLGPDMQESNRTRNLILNLVRQFSLEDDDGVRVEAIKCIQHSLMFAPDHTPMAQLVEQLSGHLSSSRRPLKIAAINALYQLVQRDALAMSRVGGDRLVEQLFAMLDDDPSIDGVRNVISSWLTQTAVHNPSAWIDLCQRIMSRTTASQQATDAAAKGTFRDDEGESLNFGGTATTANEEQTPSTSRWRTQLFALQCLHDICTLVLASGRREQVDIPFARIHGIPVRTLLVSRVADLIKMAFTASAAYVTEIRLEGLLVLRDVIKVFATSPDPDYEESLLLEQYQAPITAALTPAFSSESTPDILASAIGTCAIFVGCGVIKDAGRMGRILKLLTSAIEQTKDSGTLSLGDAGPLSPNASAMLRVATASAWAELEVASAQQTYLSQILKPYRSTLASLWLGSLRDYASIRGESEVAQEASSSTMDSSYSTLGREVLLPYYVDSWIVILQAVSSAMNENDPNILAAMDGLEDISPSSTDQSSRKDPTAMFFVLFGLIYDALASASVDSTTTPASRRTSEIALCALKSLVRPEYSGQALLQPSVLEEFIGLCYRLAMTESSEAQIHLLGALTAFAISQSRGTTGSLSWDTFQARCLRVCAHVLRRAIPSAHNTGSYAGSVSVSDRVSLIRAGFAAFAAVGETLGPGSGEDVRAAGLSLYGDLLKDESSDMDFIGPTLQSLKHLLDKGPTTPSHRDKYQRSIHGILSACLINVDNMRGRQGAIASKIIRGNLLAIVLIMTSIPTTVQLGKPVIERSCFILMEQIRGADEVALTAAQCAKTLVVSSGSASSLLRYCSRMLIPGMVDYLLMVAGLSEGSVKDVHVKAASEVMKAFSAYLASAPSDLRDRVLGVIMPTLTFLLEPTAASSPLHALCVAQLLSFAMSSPAAFKDVTMKLQPHSREVLEESLRQSLGPRGLSVEQMSHKPQISLRAF
ncbi:clathrin-coated vesicle protein [Neolentinus lepideus HHB14362 ss-1]|uniref:Clathrin-coated vesicle protein n=1 Tax=Neolentinus lepideus HHB14362 ss-1 TaxID=1314782 RepID=A0A165MF27_9AGAM|nr:clathrin-coated vesicle protein [Neolentinus lepideus HHB14362 ss-1]